MSEEPATDSEPFATALAALEDPSGGRRRLPRLVGMLDDDAESVRLGAAWAICRVASAHPDTAEYLTRRLADRLRDEEPALVTELVFGYVAATYPDTVAAELEDIESEIANRTRFRTIRGNLSRSNYHRPEIGDRGVGRTKMPGEGTTPGPQRVYTDRQEETDERDRTGEENGDARSEPESDGDGADGDRSVDDGEAAAASPTEDADTSDAGSSDADASASGPGSPKRGWQPADELPVIVYQSRFDQLTVLAKRRHGRYGDVYRTLGVVDDEEYAVGLVVFHSPGERADAFAGELSDHLERWAAVSDHENLVTVFDRGLDPRPWLAVEYTEQDLTDRSGVALGEALWNARRLAGAVEHLHDNGIVHGGIDPENVVYYGNVLDEDERQPPLLTNVGLLHVVRRYFDPTTHLDPRYAAPEYFDRRYGRVDHATDVYQLGAVLYRLATGQAPYAGAYDAVRSGVLDRGPPRPSDVADVPDALDDVVTKAMAREKLHRYETVTHLEQELRGIGADSDDDR